MVNPRTLGVSAIFLFLCLSGPGPLAQAPDLTGQWSGNDGSTYFMRQAGNEVWWYGQSGDGRTWSNVFNGSIQGNRIVGRWADTPPGQSRSGGGLELQIASANRLTRISPNNYGTSEWTRASTGSGDAGSPSGGGAGSPTSGGGSLIGSWQGRDGRVVQFAQEGGEIVGRYTALAGLGAYGFRAGDIGYRARPAGNGRYEGQVLIRYSDGRTQWQPNSITIAGDSYTDTDSDADSRSMKRVSAASGTAGGSPGGGGAGGRGGGSGGVPTSGDGSLIGSWLGVGCNGRIVQFAQEGGEIVGRYTGLDGGLVAAGFGTGDIGYRGIRSVGAGRYEGQVLWRYSDGRSDWRADTITIAGDEFRDPISDDCSKRMQRASAGGGSAAPGAGAGGVCADPRTLIVMDEWLARAIPPQQPGESMRYEAWGRMVGRSRTANVTVSGPPETRLTRCDWLWSSADQLRSTNGLGTLRDYVERRR